MFHAPREAQPLFQALFGVKTLPGIHLGPAFNETRLRGFFAKCIPSVYGARYERFDRANLGEPGPPKHVRASPAIHAFFGVWQAGKALFNGQLKGYSGKTIVSDTFLVSRRCFRRFFSPSMKRVTALVAMGWGVGTGSTGGGAFRGE